MSRDGLLQFSLAFLASIQPLVDACSNTIVPRNPRCVIFRKATYYVAPLQMQSLP